MSDSILQGERLLAHLSTDKPLYKPGETVYGRAALLDAFTRAPASRPVALTFAVKSPKGEVLYRLPAAAEGGIAAFSQKLAEDLAGGEYKLCAEFPEEGFAAQELAF